MASFFFFRLLHVAALWDNAELLEDLLNGDEIRCLDARDSWGRSALHAAATNADSKCLRVLLQSGAAASATCGVRGQCRTPLHVASEHGHSANVLLLLESGASLLDRDALGLTPMDLAEKGDHKECMEVRKAMHAFTSGKYGTRTLCARTCTVMLRHVCVPPGSRFRDAMAAFARDGIVVLVIAPSSRRLTDFVQAMTEAAPPSSSPSPPKARSRGQRTCMATADCVFAIPS